MTKNVLTDSNKHIYAVMACLLAAGLWGLLWYPLRILEARGLTGLWSTLVIYLTAFTIILPFAVKKSWPTDLPFTSLLLLSLASGWTNLAFILAMLEGTVVRVLLLFYLSPVWTIILSWCFYREPISGASIFHLSLAFIGAMILLWTDQITLQLEQADVLALSSGFAFALNNVLIRKLGNIAIVHKVAIAWFGVIVLAVIALLSTAKGLPQTDSTTILWAMLLGASGMFVMTYAAQYGVSHIPLHQSATLFLIEVPIGAISAAWLVAEIMSTREWIGGVCVMLAAWLSIQSAIKDSKISS